MSHTKRERARGDKCIEKLPLQSRGVESDSTCRPQSRGPKEPVVCCGSFDRMRRQKDNKQARYYWKNENRLKKRQNQNSTTSLCKKVRKNQNAKRCKARRACHGERRAPGGGRASPSSAQIPALTTPNVTVLRVGDAWLAGVGKRAPHGLRCPW